ncbi:glycoside hydrolase family 10 protein [Acholeplasma equifetale]|uniref:glycoside hydrolase family 10 protein n=1 Tax=Acholeplasma equifetale TaxID=264634 RepID=UPI000A960645|nr:family 10 glycosylhydrolase [Acholeplasma equifetale]
MMKRFLSIMLLFASLILLTSNSTYGLTVTNEVDSEGREFRAVWVSTVTSDMPYRPNETSFKNHMNGVFAAVEYYKYNAIIFQVRPHNNANYKSEINPKSVYFENINFDVFDPFEWVIEEAHKRGIEVHAWLNPYRVQDNQIIGSYPLENPASDSSNILSYDGKKILNPGLPNVREHIFATVEEILLNYDVDAIHFDDYFYINLGANGSISGTPNILSELDQATFIQYGAGFDTSSAASKANWRRKQVNLMVEGVHNVITNYNQSNGKNVQFGIAPTGIYKNGNGTVTYDTNGNPITTGSQTSGQEHYNSYLFSDSLEWIKNEWIDYILPQTYWSTNHSVASYYKVLSWWDKVVKYKNVNLYSGIGVYFSDDSTNTSSWTTDTQEFNNQMTYLRSLENVKGFSVFSYQHFRKGYVNSSDISAQQINNAKHHWNEYAILPEIKTMNPIIPDAVKFINHENGILTFDAVDNAKFYYIYRSTTDLTYNPSEIIGVVGGNQETFTYQTGDLSNSYVYGVRALSHTNHLGSHESDDLVEVLEGASIRNGDETTQQGLRFYAQVKDTNLVEEHGFYVVYGNATKYQLQQAIKNPVNNKIILNNKEVFKSTVNGLDENNMYSVVLINIPNIGYVDKITVFAYYKHNGYEIISSTKTTRSIAHVALNMARLNESNNASNAILNYVKNNYHIIQATPDGYSITGSIYELNRLNLKEEFISDWNQKFGSGLTNNMTVSEFHTHMKTGLSGADNQNYDISNANIYKFFNDSNYHDKWIWLVNLLDEIDTTTHTRRQAKAIKGDGRVFDSSTNQYLQTWNVIHISSSLYNFFNATHEVQNYTAINFLNSNPQSKTFYEKVAIHNQSIYTKNIDEHIIQLK